jgi:hypothetical protein
MTVEIIDAPADEAPEGLGPFCEVDGCDNPLASYSGRGRKPKRCEEHKGARAKSTSSGATNAKLARQAAEVLAQLNSMLGLGAMFLGYPMTASAIGNTEDKFIDLAASALETDPGLCRVILRAGTKSARVGLAMAYAQLGMALAPVIVMEYKARVAAAEAEAAAHA